MSALNVFDLMIVGQGIAGTCLAFAAQQAGKKVLVIDPANHRNASLSAGGCLNPITGRRNVLSWMSEPLHEAARAMYLQLEKELNISFLSQKAGLKIMHSMKEQNDLLALIGTEGYENCLQDDRVHYLPASHFNNEFGYLHLLNFMRVNAPALLHAYRAFLQANQLLLEEKFDHNLLSYSDEYVEYKNFRAAHIIFAEGVGIKENPLFQEIPVIKNKGQCLLVNTGTSFENILVGNGLNIPLQDEQWYIGATYEWKYDTEEIDEAGRDFLLSQCQKLFKNKVDISEQWVAFRATTPDRKPFIGRHNTLEKVWLFNGMGAKGMSIAPYFAHALLDLIYEGKALPAEVNPYRFQQLNAGNA